MGEHAESEAGAPASAVHPGAPAPAERRFGRLAGWVWLGGCLVAGLAVRSAGLAGRSLWFDEAYTWRLAQHPESEILARLRFDNNPPLHYLLLKYWAAAFGDGPVALRSLSALSGLAVVVGIYLFVRALLAGPGGGPGVTRREIRWAPLLAAALVALSPLQVRYSWEARMYAPGAALAVFSAWALAGALNPDPVRWGRWLGFAGLSILFLYTHTFAAVTVAVEAAVVAWWVAERAGGDPRRMVRDPIFLPAVVAFGLVAAAAAVWFPKLLAQLAFPYTRGWIPPLTSYRQMFGVAYQLFVDPGDQLPPAGPAAVRAGAVAAAFLAAAAWRGRWADGWLLALGAGPVLGAVALCLAGSQVLVTRYLVFGQPFLLALVAVAVARVRNPALMALAAVSAVTVHAYWCQDLWGRADPGRHPGYRAAAAVIAADGREDEPVLCADGMTYFPVRYHLRGRPNVWGVLQPGGWAAGDSAADKGAEFVPPDRVRGFAAPRVWVVNAEAPGGLARSVPVPAGWRVLREDRFPEAFDLGTVVLIQYQADRAGPGAPPGGRGERP